MGSKSQNNRAVGVIALTVVTVCMLVVSIFVNKKLNEGPAAFSGTFTPGTYTATTKGFGGDITATIELSETKIESITVVGDSETPGIGGRAVEELPQTMVEKQSPNVDMVSGATVSSTAIIQAVNDAFASAGVNGESLVPAE